jgi:hypothetical protein
MRFISWLVVVGSAVCAAHGAKEATRSLADCSVYACAAAPLLQVMELDPGNAWAVKTVAKLTPEVQVCLACQQQQLPAATARIALCRIDFPGCRWLPQFGKVLGAGQQPASNQSVSVCHNSWFTFLSLMLSICVRPVSCLIKKGERPACNSPTSRLLLVIMSCLQARQEKMKDEMLGKLKELGNSLLGKFGLSLDNFKAEQDPATGGYSIKFNQS